ncbi:hypothetical protein MP638_002082 [Amoeboaphelidium occidentale]|nr:hypothetical protein MP638_002082 [Amoeboaphelidium occidentale]
MAESSVLETYSYFNTLVSLIPSKFYRPPEDAPNDLMFKRKLSKKDKEDLKVIKKVEKLRKLAPADGGQSSNDGMKEEGEKKAEENTADDVRERLRKRIEELKAKRLEAKQNVAGRTQLLADRKRKREAEKEAKKQKAKAKADAAKENQIPVTKQNAMPPTPPPEMNDAHDNEIDEIDFTFTKVDDDDEKKPKKKQKLDPKSALLKLEKVAQKKAESPEDQKKTEQIAWNKTMKKAEGVKLQDDAALLKKTLKKKEKLKKKTEREWKERLSNNKEKEKKKIDKREANIKKRKEDVKQRKIEKAKKSRAKR